MGWYEGRSKGYVPTLADLEFAAEMDNEVTYTAAAIDAELTRLKRIYR